MCLPAGQATASLIPVRKRSSPLAVPMGAALIEYWRSRLGKTGRLVLETLTQAHPNAFTKEQVAARVGYDAGVDPGPEP
jgi:hypothetical protein